MGLLTSPKRGNILGPNEQDRIYQKYKYLKDVWANQADLALKLAERLEKLVRIIDDIDIQYNPKSQLHENVSDVNKTVKELLKQTSELHDRFEEFAESTTVLKR